jgi:hypothetical protein
VIGGAALRRGASEAIDGVMAELVAASKTAGG